MNTQEAIQHHVNEANQIKAQIFDAQNRLKEIEAIVATLKYVEENEQTEEVDSEHPSSD